MDESAVEENVRDMMAKGRARFRGVKHPPIIKVDGPEKRVNLATIGAVFGEMRLTTSAWSERHGQVVACQCSCGRHKVVRVEHLRSGQVTRCTKCADRRFQESRRHAPAVLPYDEPTDTRIPKRASSGFTEHH